MPFYKRAKDGADNQILVRTSDGAILFSGTGYIDGVIGELNQLAEENKALLRFIDRLASKEQK